MEEIKVKSKKYKDRFIKHLTDQGIDRDIANIELEAWLEMDYEESSNPESDADECISCWSD